MDESINIQGIEMN